MTIDASTPGRNQGRLVNARNRSNALNGQHGTGCNRSVAGDRWPPHRSVRDGAVTTDLVGFRGGQRMTPPMDAPGRSIPLARPDLGPRELELVTEVLRSDTLALGPFTERFEAAIAAAVGRAEAIACSSGTAGPALGVRGLELGAGEK